MWTYETWECPYRRDHDVSAREIGSAVRISARKLLFNAQKRARNRTEVLRIVDRCSIHRCVIHFYLFFSDNPSRPIYASAWNEATIEDGEGRTDVQQMLVHMDSADIQSLLAWHRRHGPHKKKVYYILICLILVWAAQRCGFIGISTAALDPIIR